MNGKKMNKALEQLMEQARQVHATRADPVESLFVPRPGFTTRILRRIHGERERAASPLFTFERAATWTASLAACVTFGLWILPEKTDTRALDAAALTWLEISEEESIWGGL
jgi:hypothetical protein